MQSPRHRHFSHWLTLLALVLATLAPGISRALASSRGTAAPWGLVCSAGGSAAGGERPQGGPKSLVDHCLLCTLAGDAPAMPAPPAALLALASDAAVLTASAPFAARMAWRWRPAQARAPPQVA